MDPNADQGAVVTRTSIRMHESDASNGSAAAARLPPELLCSVWHHLSLGDRFAVSQVCCRWRDIALRAPGLWTRLEFYTTRHHQQCACEICDTAASSYAYPPGWTKSPYPANTSNEHLIRRALSLSGALELNVALDIVPYSCDSPTLSALAAALGPHSARIAHLSCVTADPHIFAYLLFALARLPALRTLRMLPGPGLDAEDYCWPGAACTSLFFDTIRADMPCLEVLDVRAMPRLEWPAPNSVRLHFPALRALSLRVGRMRNLVYALRACPGLASLRIVPDAKHYQFEWTQEADDILRAIPCCRIDGLRAADERGFLLDTFLDPARQSLTLEYRDFPAEVGFGILRHVRRSILAVDECSGVVTVRKQCVDDGRVRQLVFPAATAILRQRVFDTIWADDILHENVRQISVNDSMWALFLATVPPNNRIDRLDLIVNTEDTLAADATAADSSPPVRLPYLTALSMIGGRGAAISVPSAAELMTFVRRIGSPLPLRTLELDRKLFPRESVAGALDSVALCIRSPS